MLSSFEMTSFKIIFRVEMNPEAIPFVNLSKQNLLNLKLKYEAYDLS